MMSPRYRATLTAIGVLLAAGLVCHLLAGDSGQLDAAVARVALVPKTIGAWQATDEPTDEASFAQAGARGYWTRTYVNQRTKDSVLAILMCGRAGKMAVHSPEVCYRGAGYDLNEQATPRAIENDKFWSAKFTKSAATQTHLQLYWAWNARGVWEASASPRWQFRGEPFLYKLYLSHDAGPRGGAAGTAEFLRELAPVLKATLFPHD